MAKKLKAAALPAQSPLHPHQPLITRVVDALDHLDCHLQASQALEQLIEVVKIDSREDLAHVDRGGLAFLFCLVNVATRQQFDQAKLLADAAYDEMRLTTD